MKQGRPEISGRELAQACLPLIADLRQHRRGVYWLDLALTGLVCWGSLTQLAVGQGAWPLWLLCAVLGLYRLAMFIHELAHMPVRAVPGFNLAWNLVCGIPLMLPSFLYVSHADHHSASRYGTSQDPEYLPFAHRYWRSLAVLLLGTLLTPLLLWLRFAVVGPLSWLSPRLRELVLQRFSAVTLHGAYRNNVQRMRRNARYNHLLEGLSTLWAWGLTGMLAGGVMPKAWAAWYLLVIYLVLAINLLRTCLAHRYEGDGQALSFGEQLLDSRTHDRAGAWLELFEPLGQRYHALHHLLPALPYHAMGEAHRRLLALGGNCTELYRLTCDASQGIARPMQTEARP